MSKKSYDTAYESTPEQKAKRAARGRARYAMEQKVGKAALAGKDVDHKTPLKHGGSNGASNLRVTSQKANRGWRKGKSGYSP